MSILRFSDVSYTVRLSKGRIRIVFEPHRLPACQTDLIYEASDTSHRWPRSGLDPCIRPEEPGDAHKEDTLWNDQIKQLKRPADVNVWLADELKEVVAERRPRQVSARFFGGLRQLTSLTDPSLWVDDWFPYVPLDRMKLAIKDLSILEHQFEGFPLLWDLYRDEYSFKIQQVWCSRFLLRNKSFSMEVAQYPNSSMSRRLWDIKKAGFSVGRDMSRSHLPKKEGHGGKGRR
jgi:hypothetical protein